MGIGSKVIQAAAGAGGGDKSLMALTQEATDGFVLLDISNPAAITLAATFDVEAGFYGGTEFSSGGDYIAVATGTNNADNVTLLNHSNGTVSISATYNAGSNLPASVSFSGDGYIAVGMLGGDKLIVLDNTTTDALTFDAKQTETISQAYHARFSPDGNYVALAVNQDPRIRLYSYTPGNNLSRVAGLNLPQSGAHCNWSSDGNYLVVCNDATPNFRILDHTTPGSLSTATTYTINGDAKASAFNPDGDYLAVVSGTAAGEDDITLFSYSSGSITFETTYQRITDGGTISTGLGWSADGNYLAYTQYTQNPYFILLDHTTPGSLSLAGTYTMSARPFAKDISASPAPE